MKSTWKGKKKLNSLHESTNISPFAVLDSGLNKCLTSAFNKYFVNVASGIQSSNLLGFLPQAYVNYFHFSTQLMKLERKT